MLIAYEPWGSGLRDLNLEPYTSLILICFAAWSQLLPGQTLHPFSWSTASATTILTVNVERPAKKV